MGGDSPHPTTLVLYEHRECGEATASPEEGVDEEGGTWVVASLDLPVTLNK